MSQQRYSNQRQQPIKKRKLQGSTILSEPDNTLVIIIAFLVVIGIMAIFSATAQKAMDEGANPASYMLKQLFCLVIGFFVMKFFARYDYKKLSSYALGFSWLVVGLLALVDFTPMGVMVNGAKRWMMLGPLQFQPSELAKIAVILLCGNAFYKNSDLFSSEKLKYYIPILAMVFLIYEQPNLSMIILLFVAGLTMYLSAGGPLKMILCAGLASVGVLSVFIKPYQLNRVKIWFNPESDPLGQGYNVIQSKLAFAAGGFWGVGYGNSKQKLAWLPEGHTDFIFAVVGEEFGFLGCVLVICLFLGLLHRGLIISSRCPDIYGKLVAVGITIMIGFQAGLNMSVASSFLPATGVPLPFISYGGTSLIVNLAMMGILLNISRKRIRRINNFEQTR